MREYYPEVEAVLEHRLEVDGHSVYIEECGDRNGIPVIFLHGGPGSGCQADHRRLFDPTRYRIVLFDQRGAGRSRPYGELQGNTTPKLLEDIEAIRKLLAVEQWLLFGGSWGAALALLYAEQFPRRVNGMILRGSFLARQRDLDWFFADGVARIFPEKWMDFSGLVHPDCHADLLSAYHEMLTSTEPGQRALAAQAWSDWSDSIVTYNLPRGDDAEEQRPDPVMLARKVELECHYAINHYFIRENQILEDIGSLPEVPIRIIHGRRDLTCPLESGWALKQALPRAGLDIVEEAGHIAAEPAMVDALIRATDQFAGILS